MAETAVLKEIERILHIDHFLKEITTSREILEDSEEKESVVILRKSGHT